MVVAGSWGCSTTVHSAASAAGAEVGEAVGEAVVRTYSPEFRTWYASYLTSLAFAHGGGYSLASATSDYEPGDSTVHQMLGNQGEFAGRLTKAKLFVDEEGNEAWKVQFFDAAANDTTVMEFLFSPDREQLLRLRARFPDETSGQELPVQENTYYRTPSRLTEESVEGATRGVEEIEVPAGTFDARHVRYGVPGTQGHQSWWLIDGVPGGIVRYALRAEDRTEPGDEPEQTEGLYTDQYVLELIDYGSGAESELGLEP